MADGTAIEWTHRPGTRGETWNPLAGCSLASPGCTHCYAMNEAFRQVEMQTALGRLLDGVENAAFPRNRNHERQPT